jgi:hypothetical protein
MRRQFKLASYLILIFTVIVSCSKKENSPAGTPTINLPPFQVNREYYWANAWQKTATGYEMIIEPLRLTDSAINKGIRVHVAIESEMDPFERLPITLNYAYYPDTINLSYTAVPGKLTVIAKTSVNITWPSDVFIQY